MTADEARTLLGVERGADKSTVRRAYLRLLKVHKPETDPEGFQRLREAYERLEEIARYEVVSVVPTDAAPPRNEPNEPSNEDPADRGSPLGPAERPFTSEPFAFPNLGPITPSPSQVFWDRLANVIPFDPRVAQEILSEAIVAHPDESGFYLELADLYREEGFTQASTDVLRAGMSAGVVDCAAELLFLHPDELDLEMLERVAPQVYFTDAARGYIALRQPARAFELTQARLGQDRWTDRGFRGDVAGALDVALELIAARYVSHGLDLGRLALAAGQESGVARESTRGGNVRWVLCTQFFALSAQLDDELRVAIAKSILGSYSLAFQVAVEELPDYERQWLTRRMAREAPVLGQFLGEDTRAAELRVGRFTEVGCWIGLALVLLGLLRSCDACGPKPPNAAIEALLARSRARPSHPVDAGEKGHRDDSEQELLAAEATVLLCEQGRRLACERAQLVLGSWRRSDCAARIVPRPIRPGQDAGPGVHFDIALPEAVAELVRRCEERSSETP